MGFKQENINVFTGNQLINKNVCNFASKTCLFLHSNICCNELT